MPFATAFSSNNSNNTSKPRQQQQQQQGALAAAFSVLPKSRSAQAREQQQKQQQQLHQGQQQQQQVSYNIQHHHQQQYSSPSRSSVATRGAKELGMLVMLLTAEAALSLQATNQVIQVHQQQQHNSGTSTPSSANSGSVENVSKNSKSHHLNSPHPVFGSSSASSEMISRSDSADDLMILPSPSNKVINSKTSSPSSKKQQQQQQQQQVDESATATFSLFCSSEDGESDDGDQQQQRYIVVSKKNKQVTFLNVTAATSSTSYTSAASSLLNAIFAFLPWRDAAVARGTSKTWQIACSAVNCLFFALPRTSCPAVFIYSQSAFDEEAEVKIEPRFVHKSDLGKWKCDACGFVNSETRILCGSRNCQMPIPTHRTAARLFAGQLRREGTVPYLRWLFEDIIGSDKHCVRIKNVENHRDSNSQRGKGCGWLYLENLEMANCAVDMHHRMFSDVDTEGREGVWIVPQDSRDKLATEIERVSYVTDRPRALPRGALVVERPVMTPQMAPENAPISSKVLMSHQHTVATAATNNNSMLMISQKMMMLQQKQQQENQQQQNQKPKFELVQRSPQKLNSQQGKRFAHNPYAYQIEQKKEEIQNFYHINNTISPSNFYNAFASPSSYPQAYY